MPELNAQPYLIWLFQLSPRLCCRAKGSLTIWQAHSQQE